MQRCIDSINVTTLPFRCECSNIFLSDMTIGQSIQILYFLTDYQVAGAEGIEPSSKVLETPILPLNYAPI